MTRTRFPFPAPRLSVMPQLPNRIRDYLDRLGCGCATSVIAERMGADAVIVDQVLRLNPTVFVPEKVRGIGHVCWRLRRPGEKLPWGSPAVVPQRRRAGIAWYLVGTVALVAAAAAWCVL